MLIVFIVITNWLHSKWRKKADMAAERHTAIQTWFGVEIQHIKALYFVEP